MNRRRNAKKFRKHIRNSIRYFHNMKVSLQSDSDKAVAHVIALLLLKYNWQTIPKDFSYTIYIVILNWIKFRDIPSITFVYLYWFKSAMMLTLYQNSKSFAFKRWHEVFKCSFPFYGRTKLFCIHLPICFYSWLKFGFIND